MTKTIHNHEQIHPIDDKPGWIQIFCAGGCGRHVRLRKKKIVLHDYYICDSKASKYECEARLSKPLAGQIRVFEFNSAAAFIGISYKWPDVETMASLARAKSLLTSGLAQQALKKIRALPK